MGWMDDFSMRIGQIGTGVRDRINRDINDYVENRAVDDLVKIGRAATGNLSAAEIEAGQRGAPAPIAPAASMTAGFSVSPYLIAAAVGLTAVLLLSKKSRRG
jgi:hypothetical protein